MNLVIYINDTHEEEKALYDLDRGKIVLKGDYYHDKIDYLISGYLMGKDIDEDSIEEIYINSYHELFEELEFYDGNLD